VMGWFSHLKNAALHRLAIRPQDSYPGETHRLPSPSTQNQQARGRERHQMIHRSLVLTPALTRRV